jgi:hypothetical protein
MLDLIVAEADFFDCMHGMGIHGLPKVSLGPVMPYLFMTCGWLPLNQPYGHFRGNHPKEKRPVAVFYCFGHSMLYASVKFNMFIQLE